MPASGDGALLPSADPAAPRSLLVVGTLPDIVEDQLQRLFDQLGIPVTFFPARSSRALPRGTALGVSAGAAVPGHHGAGAAAARRHLACRPLPAGHRRNARLAAGCGSRVRDPRCASTLRSPPRSACAQAALQVRQAELAGKRVFFFPTRSWGPARALPHRELNMQLVEVGTPTIRRTSRRAGASARKTLISEGQDVERQPIAACRPSRIWWSAGWDWRTRWK